MRFKAKYVIPEPDPGTTRLKRVFAWWPKDIDGVVTWMEYYEILQAYVTFDYTVKIDSEIKSIKVGEWKSLSNRLII